MLHTASPATQHIGASIPRPDSTSTPQSTMSLAPSQSSSSRQGSWQQTPGPYAVSAPGAQVNITAQPPPQLGGSGLTNWRSHDSVSSVHSSSANLQDQSHIHAQHQYSASTPSERAQWAVTPTFPYQEPQRTSPLPQSSPQAQQQFAPTSIPAYGTAGAQQQAPYAAPPQNEFQSMTVQSPSAYPVPQPQAYGQQAQYPVPQMQVPPPTNTADYPGQQSQLTQTPMAAPGYPTSQGEQYGQPQVHPPMHYRDDGRAYSLTHYPSG
jgi:hypothetical protein